MCTLTIADHILWLNVHFIAQPYTKFVTVQIINVIHIVTATGLHDNSSPEDVAASYQLLPVLVQVYQEHGILYNPTVLNSYWHSNSASVSG
jgi:hypothetical protein